MPTRKVFRLSGPKRRPKAPPPPRDDDDDLDIKPRLVPEPKESDDEEEAFAEKRLTTYSRLLWGNPEQIRAALLKEAQMKLASMRGLTLNPQIGLRAPEPGKRRPTSVDDGLGLLRP